MVNGSISDGSVNIPREALALAWYMANVRVVCMPRSLQRGSEGQLLRLLMVMQCEHLSTAFFAYFRDPRGVMVATDDY